jgi:hypothetical protein
MSKGDSPQVWLLMTAILTMGVLSAGCGREDAMKAQMKKADAAAKAQVAKDTKAADAPAGETAPGAAAYCDFKGGPDTACVKVVAYYPGRHEDTLAAVKGLLEKFPGDVQVEIVDWRTESGLKRREAAKLTCAGVTINGKNAFDVTVEGKPSKVLFVRGINGEWTEADLQAAVKQEVDAAKKK